jgi:hypothetical protein
MNPYQCERKELERHIDAIAASRRVVHKEINQKETLYLPIGVNKFYTAKG